MFKNHLPGDIIRHTFKILLNETPLEIFNFTKEWFESGEYEENEIPEMIKNAIIQNFELTKVPFFHYCTKNNQSVFISELFLDNLNVLKSIKNNYLYKGYSGLFFKHIIKSKNFKLIDWIRVQHFEKCYSLCQYACAENDLEMLRFLRDGNPSFPIKDEICFVYAIGNGNFEMLEYLCKEINPCKWDDFCYMEAMKSNDLKMLKFLKGLNNSVPWCKYCTLRVVYYDNLEMLRFMREGNEPSPWHDNCCLQAIQNNNLEMLKFLRERNDPCPWDEWCCWYAAKNNNFQILKFLRRKNNPCPWNKSKCLEICVNPQMIEWINSQE
jgi:hypothetical protein